MGKRKKSNKHALELGLAKLLEDHPKIKFIDSHNHLNMNYDRLVKDKKYEKRMEILTQKILHCEKKEDLEKKEIKAILSSLEFVIAIFCEPVTFGSFSMFDDMNKENKYIKVHSVVGIHPHEAKNYEKVEKGLLNLLETKKDNIVAVGEIGLDYHYNNSLPSIQKKVFEKQLKIAVKKNFPVVIHSREAEKDTIEIMKKNLPKDWNIHVHCYTSEDPEFLKELLTYFTNCYIGFTGILTYNSTKETLQKTCLNVPLNRILLESDSPYLPVRCKKYIKSGRIDSTFCNIPFVGLKVAEIHNIKYEKLMEMVIENTKKMYKIK